MAHILNDLMDKVEGRKKKPCDSGCEYYKFDHMDCACLLSEVYSVNKGEGCYIYKVKEGN